MSHSTLSELHIDIETYSDEPLVGPKSVGLYKYALHPSFEIMLMAYKIDDRPTELIDFKQGGTIPLWLIDLLKNANVKKKAWNAAFEIFCLSRHLGYPLDPSQWECTMIKAGYNGLSLSLDAAGLALGLDKAKMSEGKDLIKYFCSPCKPTKKNDNRTRNHWHHDKDKWALFRKYVMRDVDAETEADRKMVLKLPKMEQELYAIDQRINKRGVLIDVKLIERILHMDQVYRDTLRKRAIEITGLQNPNSVAQLKEWLEVEMDDYIPSLDKDHIKKLKEIAPNGMVAEMLHIRSEMAQSAIKKFPKALSMADNSGRVRGQFQFYGATRTGRWAGRGVQLHNLSRNKLKVKQLTFLRNLVRQGIDIETFMLLYDSPSTMFKELIRPAFIPSTGYKFVVGDFHAIEAVVLSWLAGEQWRLRAFEAHKDIYIASASKMFKIPEAEIGEDSPLRQRGKVSELALGYGGGANALIQMGALEMGLKLTELDGIKDAWRSANPAIVRCWKDLQKAFIYALQHPGEVVACLRGIIKFQVFKGKMLMRLPAGRCLVYDKPSYVDGELSYYGQDQKTGRYLKQKLYGGKIAENVTQAIARDLLAHAMLKVDKLYPIVLHVHDEIAIEVPDEDSKAAQEMTRIMADLPEWATGMPVRASVFETTFYRKG